MLMAALAATLLASGPLHLSNECWFVSFMGPEDREQLVKRAADEKFDKPSAGALKIARRPGIDVLVFTEDAINCAGDPPIKVVVVSKAGTETIALTVEGAVKGNAFGVRKTFYTGKAILSQAKFDQLLSTNGLLHLVAKSGRVGQWQVGADE